MKNIKYMYGALAAVAFAAAAIAVPLTASVADAATANITASVGAGGPAQHGMWGSRGGAEGVGMTRPAVMGTVSTINGDTLTVTEGAHRGFGSTTVATATTTYTVDTTNATVLKNNATSSVSSIAVGDMVAVQGTLSGTSVTATSIRDGFEMRMGPAGGQGGQNGFQHRNNASSSNNMPISPITGNGQPVVAGAITAINGTSLTITNKSNVSYTVDVTNAKIVEGQNTVTSVSGLAVGDNVIVQGTVSGTSITASSVIDQKAPVSGGRGMGGGFFGAIGGFFSKIFGF